MFNADKTRNGSRSTRLCNLFLRFLNREFQSSTGEKIKERDTKQKLRGTEKMADQGQAGCCSGESANFTTASYSTMPAKHRPAVPPLPRLRVKNQVAKQQANPCLVIMSQMLNCWASNGEGNVACKGLEQELKGCMAKGVKVPPPQKPTLNYHAARLLPKIHKQEKK